MTGVDYSPGQDGWCQDPVSSPEPCRSCCCSSCEVVQSGQPEQESGGNKESSWPELLIDNDMVNLSKRNKDRES